MIGPTFSETHAVSCILGAFTGDALGAPAEFGADRPYTDEELANFMTMPGGGHFDVGPGQVTDDSELAF